MQAPKLLRLLVILSSLLFISLYNKNISYQYFITEVKEKHIPLLFTTKLELIMAVQY